jgi:CRP-like cAMP-binding protein
MCSCPNGKSAMVAPEQSAVRNQVLAGLSPEDFALLQPHLEPVPLELCRCLHGPDQAIEHLYFPEMGLASLTNDGSSSQIELGIIGREGMTGVPVVLGTHHSPFSCFVQMEGHGLRLATAQLEAALIESRSLDRRLRRYAQALTVQVAGTAFANAEHTVEMRLARWLLMCHDRVDGDDLATTHEFLSLMLGVRRAGVTLALQGLEDRGLISTRRGQVKVVDRVNLEAVAGDSYGVPEAEYSRLIGLPLGPAELPALRVCRSGR